jgi:drug/metabolite transporter (DMT)-like permease
VFVLVARHGYRQVPTEQAMTVVLTTSALVALLLAVTGGALDAVWLPFSMPELLVTMLAGGLFAAAVPSFLFLAGVRWIGGVRTGILMLAQAPVGVALAAIFLGESVGVVQVVGGVAILAGAVIIQRGAAGGAGGDPHRIPPIKASIAPTGWALGPLRPIQSALDLPVARPHAASFAGATYR